MAEEVLAKAGMKKGSTWSALVEIPRAAFTASAVAKKASSSSFGTNDLTQTTMGLSRDDFCSSSWAMGEENFRQRPVAVLDQEGVGQLVRGRQERAQGASRYRSRHLRRTRRRAEAQCSSATGSAWTTSPALRSAFRSPAWPRHKLPSAAIRTKCPALHKQSARNRDWVFPNHDFNLVVSTLAA